MEKIRVDENEISLKRIVELCLRNIGKILICGLVCAIIFTSIMYANELSKYNNQLQNSNVEYELTEEDFSIINKYQVIKSRIEYLKEYEKNSILMSFDSNNMYSGNITYQVVGDEEVKYDIARLLVHYVNVGGLATEISEKNNLGEPEYIQEILYGGLYEITQGVDSSIVTIQILAKDEEMYQTYVKCVKEQIENHCNIALNIGNAKVVMVEENAMKQYITAIYETQRNYYDKLNSAETDLANCVATLSVAQKAYIDEMENTSSEIQDAVNPVKPVIDVKYAVVGAFIGCFIAVVAVAVSVMFGGRLQTDNELSRRLGIINIGVVDKNKQVLMNRLISKVIYGRNVESIGEQMQMLVNKLKMLMKNSALEDIVLVGTYEGAENELEVITNSFKENGINCTFDKEKKNILELVVKMNDAQKIILVEKIGVSRIREIYEVANVCSSAKKDVVGYITIRE